MLPQLWTALTLLAVSASAQPLAAQQGSALAAGGNAHQARAIPDRVARRANKQLRRRKCKTPTTPPVNNGTTSEPVPNQSSVAPVPNPSGSTPPANPSGTTPEPNPSGTTPEPNPSGTAPEPVTSGTPAGPATGGNYPEPKFRFGGPTKMRGVNLGGWLLIEHYLTPSSLLDPQGAADQWNYDSKAANDQGARDMIMNHYQTFITPDDIQQIADIGLNTVRIPVGYWSFLGGGRNGEPYLDVDIFPFLDPVIEKCAQLGIAVIMDMHGLPGSQNGQDNSGHLTDQIGWYHNDDWKNMSIEFALAIVKKYGNGAFGGIVQSVELMNEPQPRGDNGNFEFQMNFFREAYEQIRAADPEINVMYADGWDFPLTTSRWGGFGANQKNVAMDTHIYTLFNDETKNMGFTRRLQNVCSRVEDVKNAESNMPTIIGEWTSAVGGCDDGDCTTEWTSPEFFDFIGKHFAWQSWVYEHATGWTYWNWKMEDAKADDAWGLKSGLKNGWLTNIDEMQQKWGAPCSF